MRTKIKEHKGLRIKLLSFNKPTQETEGFYFLEMSTLQATTLMQKDRKLIAIKVTAYNDQNDFLDELAITSFQTINDFNSFFIKNPDYYIHDCDLELEGNLIISSHDDGEVSIQIDKKNSDFGLIQNIFKEYNIDIDLISILKKNLGHYIEIDTKSQIIGNYQTFDNYIEKKNIN